MEKMPDIHAAIVGTGPYKDEMVDMVNNSKFKGNFHFLGRRNDIEIILSSADVLLLTSMIEGTPNVVLEAQLHGCPVVATRAGGTVDAVLDGETGILVETGDINALTSGLLELLQDDDKRRSYGKAGINFVKTQFNLDKMVDETLRLYQKAIKDREQRHEKKMNYQNY